MGGVDPDRALERAVVAAREGKGYGSAAGSATRDVEADVGPHEERRNRLAQEEVGPWSPRRGRGGRHHVGGGGRDRDWGRGGGRRRYRGRERRLDVGRRRYTGQEFLDHGGVLGVVGVGADEDVLPPEGEKELKVRFIDRAGGGSRR